MSPLRKSLLGLVVAAMVWLMVATWGSIGSMVMVFGLIMMGAALLYQRFLNRDDPGDRDIYE